MAEDTVTPSLADGAAAASAASPGNPPVVPSPADDTAAAAALKRADSDHAAAEERRRATRFSRDASLARAAEADHAAALAKQERDAVEARIREAEAHAAAARAEIPDDFDGHVSVVEEDPVIGDIPVCDALLHHVAAAIINQHAQAVAVQNIRTLIPVVLNVTSTTYAHWRETFLLTLGRLSLRHHVLSDEVPVASPNWDRMDCVVRAWIQGAISDDLVAAVLERGATAQAAWLAIESQFLGNRETRALLLDRIPNLLPR